MAEQQLRQIQWTSSRFTLSAVIGGIPFPDVVAFSSDFEKMTIPLAVITVSVGARVDTLKAATIHTQISNMRIRLPATVTMTVTSLGSSPGSAQTWPAGSFTIFDGYAVGCGYSRSTYGAKFVIHLQHWLADLNYSSSLNSSSHPTNLWQLNYPAVTPSMQINQGAGAGQPAWTAGSVGGNSISMADLQTDLWGRVLQTWLVRLAQQPGVNVAYPDEGASTNTSALAALRRMPPLSPSTNCPYVPSQLDPAGADASAVVDGILNSLRSESFKNWSNQTLWGKLIGEWCPAYFLSVIPRISDALVVPFTAGLQTPYSVQIDTDDYVYADLNRQLPQMLRGVGIMYSAQMRAGSSGDYAPQVQGLAGYWPTSADIPDADRIKDGLILLRDAPGWLSNPVNEHRFAMASTGNAGQQPIGTAGNPGVGQGLPAGQVSPAAKIASIVGPNKLMPAFAHQWYVTEILKGGIGEIAGKLRFDIAPGSCVRVMSAGTQTVLNGDQLAIPFLCTILRVSTMLNVEAQQAGTAFAVAHIRTESENSDPKLSIAKPALYTQPWPGCQLFDY